MSNVTLKVNGSSHTLDTNPAHLCSISCAMTSDCWARNSVAGSASAEPAQ
jgi:hypothetical protein